MDLKMPVMDGYEATHAIKQRDEWRGIPIIALTAHARPQDKGRCMAAGMVAFVTKPVNFEALYAIIDKYL
jgi:two-component system, sensor histidine kinase and response regulator